MKQEPNEYLKEHLENWAREDKDKLLNLIPLFHGVFARTKDPQALEVAKNLGIAVKKLGVHNSQEAPKVG